MGRGLARGAQRKAGRSPCLQHLGVAGRRSPTRAGARQGRRSQGLGVEGVGPAQRDWGNPTAAQQVWASAGEPAHGPSPTHTAPLKVLGAASRKTRKKLTMNTRHTAHARRVKEGAFKARNNRR